MMQMVPKVSHQQSRPNVDPVSLAFDFTTMTARPGLGDRSS